MNSRDERDAFFNNLRKALGRSSVEGKDTVPLAPECEQRSLRSSSILDKAADHAEERMAAIMISAKEAGWKVTRVSSPLEAASYIVNVVSGLKTRILVRSGHGIVEEIALEQTLSPLGVGVFEASADRWTETNEPHPCKSMRNLIIQAEVGVTGVDYAIIETGSCVIMPRKGISRLVSLLPPTLIAIVERGQVLADLDEFAVLAGHKLIDVQRPAYISVISGPSRSADIQQTLVIGVHGPGDVHMVLIG